MEVLWKAIKTAAAIAAVNQYFEMETTELAQPSEQPVIPGRQYCAPVIRMNFWGGSGRQSQMQIRTLMQLRAFHKMSVPIRG